MRDTLHSPTWVADSRHFSAEIHKLIRAVLDGFDWLNAYQFDAPWLVRANAPETKTR